MRSKAPSQRARQAALPNVPVHVPAPVPTPPEHLSPEAVEVWEWLWTMGGSVYADTDRFILERYADLQGRRLHLLRVLDAEGWTSMGSKGQAAPHPAARILADVESKLTGLEDRLFLNPEKRVNFQVFIQEKASKLDLFLSGMDGGEDAET